MHNFENCQITSTEEYGYVNGKLKRIYYFDASHKKNGTCEYSYFKNKTKITEHWFIPENERYNIVVKYDKLKHVSHRKEYENGKLSEYIHYFYDDSSRLTTFTSFNSKKQKVETYTYLYNDNGDLKSEKIINYIDSTDRTTTYSFDSTTNTTTKNTISNKSIEIEKYNDKGLLILSTSSNLNYKDIIKIEYIYEFDSHENWIKKTEVMNGTNDTITERKIIYY